MNKLKITAIDGAVRRDSKSRILLRNTAEAFDHSHISVTIFDQSLQKLPLYDDAPEIRKNAAVQKLLSSVLEADAIILSSPEYHGSMSGALKNALDWCTLVEGEFQGKVIGLLGGGGSLANSGANIQMMMAVRAMHGWLMPDVLLSVPNIWNAFDEVGGIRDTSVQARLGSFVERLTFYAGMFRENRRQFNVAA
jgi:FMN reductase